MISAKEKCRVEWIFYDKINRTKKFRQEVTGYKRTAPTSRSGGSQRKRSKGPERQIYKRGVPVKKAAESRSSRCMTKGDQSGSEEEDSKSPVPTTRIQATGSSLNAGVVKSRNRSRGADNQAVRVHNEAEDPDSKNARR
ncbi:hypothetical protein TNIN_283731 [Trichonephila inaurata madagascariensis]|uniref:Uncharacterized protein n=1 Tax=Trichonephila inaurata madagascariensis TaxID=2747483 RepID=A0A8X6YRP7_9ARAC|nr:hypothetical protein TNIN_283731 [Trichonephila inaurata madagascariensis]